MITCVTCGRGENGKFYVQTCCDQEHNGSKCDCKSLGEDFTLNEAEDLAEKKAKELNVTSKKW